MLYNFYLRFLLRAADAVGHDVDLLAAADQRRSALLQGADSHLHLHPPCTQPLTDVEERLEIVSLSHPNLNFIVKSSTHTVLITPGHKSPKSIPYK